MPVVRIRFRDTETGEEGVHTYDITQERADDVDDDEGFFWTDGNGGCDCERARLIAASHGRPDPNIGCGSWRVVIEEATVDGKPRNWK